MRFPVVLMWLNAALFVVFGIGFIVAPALLSQLITGATPGTTSALIDLRATYGGMALGIGLFWGYCARRPGTLRIGLLSSLLVLVGIALGRLVGMIVDGSPNTFMFVLLAAELLFIGLVALALRRTSETPV